MSDRLITEIKVECTCGNKLPVMEITNLDNIPAIRVRCDTCQAGYLRLLHLTEDDQVLKGPGYLGDLKGPGYLGDSR